MNQLHATSRRQVIDKHNIQHAQKVGSRFISKFPLISLSHRWELFLELNYL